MKSLLVHLPPGERRCAIETDALVEFARTLIDDLLFDAARQASDAGNTEAIGVTMRFAVTLDEQGLRITR